MVAVPHNRGRLKQMAHHIKNLHPSKNPFTNPAHGAAVSAADPQAAANLAAIHADPELKAIATGQADSDIGTGSNPGGSTVGGGGGVPTATDPTGSVATGAGLGWGNERAGRNPGVRHVLLGFTALTLTAAQTNAAAKATPNVDFKPNRFVSMPGVTGTISQIQSGIRPQYVSGASEDLDMYQPLSYGGELDLDAVKAAVPINAFVTNGNATASQTFYGCFIGQAIGMKYRRMTSKLMNGSLGTSGSVSAAGTGSLVLTPQIAYTARKVILTPGTTFSDAFIITSITAGIQNQLMSNDPIPASVFSDLYPLFVDFDRVTPSVPLTVAYTNVSTGAATLKGSTRGDCNPADLARYTNMTDIGGMPAGG